MNLRRTRPARSQTDSAFIAREIYLFLCEMQFCTNCRNAFAVEGKRKCSKCAAKRQRYTAQRRKETV